MRFVTFETGDGVERFGFLTNTGKAVDIEGAYAARLARELPANKAYEIAAAVAPGEALSFIDGGEIALRAARDARDFVEHVLARGEIPAASRGEIIVFESERVRFKAPVPRPRKMIAAGKNFRDHMGEMRRGGGNQPKWPIGFAQAASTVVGPGASIPYPPETAKLDYEVEVAVVIGKRALDVGQDAALDHVFGYTIFNDISTRDMYREEGVSGIPLLGKNLPGFAPMGPWLCTPDELGEVQALGLRCRVNGETRQDSSLANMIFGIDELIAHWSRIDLVPGDILSTGTPSGVAAGRKPDQSSWWLAPGDVIESEVDRIGVLTVSIV